MFTRILACGVHRATASLSRPAFAFSSPTRFLNLDCLTLQARTLPLMPNLHIQNLLQFLAKCEQQSQAKSESTSLSQLSLLAQGKAVLSIMKMIDLSCPPQQQVDALIALSKLPQTHPH